MLLIAIVIIGVIVVLGNVETKNIDAYKKHDEIFYDNYLDM